MKRQWIIDEDFHQTRIDEFLLQHGINKKCLKDIKMKGEILVDNCHQTVRYLLQKDEVLSLFYPTEVCQIVPTAIPFRIAYEDEFLLVVDKPRYLPSIPTRRHPTQTLANALSYYYRQIGLSSTIHLVNRLDKDTSGLMIIAKYREIHDLMMKDFSHIYRRYRATVEGCVKEQGTIDLPIYREPLQMRRKIDERGKEARTHYYRQSYDGHCSCVEFVLETGRTHQIRLHMASIGHPLLGDCLYGESKGHFDLESFRVAFVHPVTKQIKVIQKQNRKKHIEQKHLKEE